MVGNEVFEASLKDFKLHLNFLKMMKNTQYATKPKQLAEKIVLNFYDIDKVSGTYRKTD